VPRAPRLSRDPSPSRITRKSYGPRVPNRTMVAKFDHVLLVGFGTDRLRRQDAMKTAGKENPNRCAIIRRITELLGRQLQASLLNQSGWKARKHPAVTEYFFLTFPFIELIRSDESCCKWRQHLVGVRRILEFWFVKGYGFQVDGAGPRRPGPTLGM
jgi:hypothetical protein